MKKQSPLRNRVKELRARLGIRQADLARDVGITRQTIIAIEKGRLNPSILICLKVARLLREPVDYVFYLAPGWDSVDGTFTEEAVDEAQEIAGTRVRVSAKGRRAAAGSEDPHVGLEADPVKPPEEPVATPERYALDRDADAGEEPDDAFEPESTDIEAPVESEVSAPVPAGTQRDQAESAAETEKQGQAIWDFF
jgi:putative transcriptional regulator